MKLTQAFIKRSKCENEKQKQEFYDDELKGFILEVKSNGRKTYFLRHNNSETKKIKYHRIADATILPLEEAKLKAIKLKRSLEEGKVVCLSIKKEEQAVITLDTFYQTEYLPHIKTRLKSWKSVHSIVYHHLLPKLGNVKMIEIKRPSLIQMHRDMMEKKRLSAATSNIMLIYLSAMFRYALELEYPNIKENPVQGIKLFRLNNAKERYLSKRETKRLLEAIEQSKNPLLRFIIPFLILTGARKSEVTNAKWNEIDFVNKIWTIPTSKNGKKRHIPLSETLEKLLTKIPKRSVYIFPSPITGKPFINIHGAWDTARQKGGQALFVNFTKILLNMLYFHLMLLL